MRLPKRILVATDFSETSDRALDYAMDLAAAVHASIILLHAYEIPVVGFPDGAYIASADVATRLAAAAQAGLDATVEKRRDHGVEVKAVLREDTPWDAVNAVAKELGADLVVAGTHGRKGLAHALLGSVAEKIIRTCDVPVLTIRGPRDHAR
jgi:nucleotide-binding universal stress UspA family protein